MGSPVLTLIGMADETIASPSGGGGDAPTQIHPPAVLEELLAYSESPDADLELYPSWRRALRIAAGVVMVSMAVSAGIVLGRDAFVAPRAAPRAAPAATSVRVTETVRIPEPAPSALPSAAPPVAAEPSEPDVVPKTSTPNSAPLKTVSPPSLSLDDKLYLAALQNSGVTITNQANAIAAGHTVCTALAQGHSHAEIVAAIVRNNPTFDQAAANGSVSAAQMAYCPSTRR